MNKKRKKKPEPPKWYNCWMCKNRNGYGSCKRLKIFRHRYKEKSMDLTKITINHCNGTTTVWEKPQWDEYTYIDHCFVIIKETAWVGIYNMDDVDNIVVK